MLRQKISLAVIINSQGKILLSQRKKGIHLESLWEFPGGKLNSGESFKQALRREIKEELNINLGECKKLIDFNYCYPDRELHFQVFIVPVKDLVIHHAEKQNIRWIEKSKLKTLDLPSANEIICNALLMPDLYMIADYKVLGNKIISLVEKQLLCGVRMVQYRITGEYIPKQTIEIGYILKKLCDKYSATLVLNSNWQLWQSIKPHGVHIKSCDLSKYRDLQDEIPFQALSAACHTEHDVEMINQCAIHSAVVGSVHPTQTHPEARAIGWIGFSRLCQKINKPVYAIGGCNRTDVRTSQVYGGQGIASIRGFLN